MAWSWGRVVWNGLVMCTKPNDVNSLEAGLMKWIEWKEMKLDEKRKWDYVVASEDVIISCNI